MNMKVCKNYLDMLDNFKSCMDTESFKELYTYARPIGEDIFEKENNFNSAVQWVKRSSRTYDEVKTQFTEKEKRNKEMIYHVKFEGTDKLYAYYCAPHVKLQIGSTYMIEADGATTYKNAATLIKVDNYKPANVHIRTITHARLVSGSKRPDDRIKQVIFNKEKGTTVVLWKDGQKTIVKQQYGDEWDEEKALAMCYMKRVLGNRGSFNETLRKWTNTTH